MQDKGKSGIICQARLSSSRLPGKVLYDLGGKNSIELIYLRYKKQLDQNLRFTIATSTSKEDKAIKIFCEEKNIQVFAGDLENVLLRYYECSKKLDLKYIIRITSDCPFIDFRPVNKMISLLVKNNLDYVSNTHAYCRICESRRGVVKMTMPFACKLLCQELAGMQVGVRLLS